MPDSDADLEHEYARAWEEWDAPSEAQAWETTVRDGLDDDPCADSEAQQAHGQANG